jgi:tight adherence protein B
MQIPEGELESQFLIAVLGSFILLGATLFALLRADRRRESRQQRLKAITATTPSAGEPAAPLRRPLRQGSARRLFLLPAGVWARLDAGFAATGNTIGAPHLILTGLVAAIAVIGVASRLMGFNPVFAVVLGGTAGMAAPAMLLRRAQDRYQNRFLDVFPDALDLLGRAVTAGLPVADAMEVAAHEIRAPVGSELQRTLDEMRIGVELEEALQHTAERVRLPDFRFYIVALSLQRRTGGSLAETLGHLSDVIRRRKELRLKTRALTAESRASATVLAITPFIFIACLSLLNPKLFSTLLADPRGRFMMVLAVLSILIGITVMFWMIRRSLR